MENGQREMQVYAKGKKKWKLIELLIAE